MADNTPPPSESSQIPAPALAPSAAPSVDAGAPAASGTPTGAGTPAGSGTPTGAGTPAASGTPTGAGAPAASGTPTGAGTPAASGTPTGAGTPAASGTPDFSGLAQLSALSGALEHVQTVANNLEDVDKATKRAQLSQRFQAIGQSALEAADALSAVAGVIRGALIGVVNPAKELEKALSNVAASSGMETSDLAILRTTALQEGSKGWATPAQTVTAMGQLWDAGFKLDQITQGINPVITFGRANDMAPPEAAALVGNAMQQYKINPGETTRVTDTLTAAVKNSKLGMPDFGEALKAAAPAATSAGLSLEQTSALIAHLSNQGIAARDIGPTLTAVISRLTSALPETTRATLETLGVTTRDGQGKLLPIPDILTALDKAMTAQGYGGPQRLETMNAIFGPQSGVPGQANVAIVNKLVQGMAQDGFPGVAGEIANSTGQAAKTAEIKDGNLDGSLLQFNNALTALQTTLGSTLIPALTETIKALTGLVNWVNSFAAAHPGLTRFFLVMMAVVAALLTALVPILMVAGAFGLLMVVMGPLSGIALVVIGVIGGLIAGLVILAGYMDEIASLFKSPSSWLPWGSSDDEKKSDKKPGEIKKTTSDAGALPGVDFLNYAASLKGTPNGHFKPMGPGLSDIGGAVNPYAGFDPTLLSKVVQGSQATPAAVSASPPATASSAAASVEPTKAAAAAMQPFGDTSTAQGAGLAAMGTLAGAVNDNTLAMRTGQASPAAIAPAAANVVPFPARLMPAPAMAELGRGPGGENAGAGGFGGGGPVTVNLSVNITGSTEEDIVRRLELWVRNDGAHLIADAVARESQRRERTQFMRGAR